MYVCDGTVDPVTHHQPSVKGDDDMVIPQGHPSHMPLKRREEKRREKERHGTDFYLEGSGSHNIDPWRAGVCQKLTTQVTQHENQMACWMKPACNV